MHPSMCRLPVVLLLHATVPESRHCEPICSKRSRRNKQRQPPRPPSPLPAPQVVCDENGCRLVDSPDFESTPSRALKQLRKTVDPARIAPSVLDNLAKVEETGNLLLPTPAVYEELLREAAPSDVTVVRYGAPWCRSCRTIGPELQALAAARWAAATFYEMSLVRDGKAAGERMYRHYKARRVSTMPLLEVFVGSELVERLDASALDLRSGDRPG